MFASDFINLVKKYSCMNKGKLEFLVNQKGIPFTSIVECGVMNGGSLLALARGNDCEIWGFDSWEGCPAPGKEDIGLTIAKAGFCKGDINKVNYLINHLHDTDKRFHLIPGWFQDTIPYWKDRIDDISVLHIDGDWYESVLYCLQTLYDSVIDGGIVIVDDYGAWNGANLAVHEFISDKPVTLERHAKYGVWWRK